MSEYFGFITIRETRMGDVSTRYAEERWPQTLLVSQELLNQKNDGTLIVTETSFSFMVDNGFADYEKFGEDESGNWKGRLVRSEWSEPPQRLV